jgi:hypothetical protein
MFAVIIDNTKEFVADIKIDPLKKFVFWSQWDINDENVEIMRSNQDGTDPTKILAMIPSTNTTLLEMIPLRKPSLLTIDFRNEKLYFIDKRLYLLGSLDYFGNYTQVIPHDEENKIRFRDLFHYAYSLDIFRNTIYWSSLGYVYSIPENGDLYNLKKVVSSEYSVNCLTVFDPSRQPYGPNHCANNNCCGLCLPTRKNFKCALNQTTSNSLCDVSFQTNKKCKKNFNFKLFQFFDKQIDKDKDKADKEYSTLNMTEMTTKTTSEKVGLERALDFKNFDLLIIFKKFTVRQNISWFTTEKHFRIK